MNILTFENVYKYYTKEIPALKNINFSASEGDFISIIGPSGAGKSTFLRCINRMISADRGNISFYKADVLNSSKKELRNIRRSIGMVFQNHNLVNNLSVYENVLHGRLGFKSNISGILGMYSEEEKNSAFLLMEKLGISDHAYKRCDELSSGQKQRVGIARALMQNPKLLICDEPIASLDPNSSKIIMDHLKSINTEMGITCILSLHHVDIALKYSKTIVAINNGQIVFHGTPKELSLEKIHSIYGSESGDLFFEKEDLHEKKYI